MSVHEFVKRTYRDKHWEILEKEMKTFLDPITGHIKSEYLRETRCAVCLSESYKLSFEKDGFCFVKCEGCGLLYVNPQLVEEKIISNYEDSPSSDSWVDVLLSREEQEFNIKISSDLSLKILMLCIRKEVTYWISGVRSGSF